MGIGLQALEAAADECDAASEYMRAAELMYAAMALKGAQSGAEAKRAWMSLRQLEKAGQGSEASRALKARVGSALTVRPSL